MQKTFFWLCALLLAAVCVGNYFYDLDGAPIHIWDEARHAISALEMRLSGNWLVNTYMGANDYWNVKPPLSFWNIGIGYELFGVNLFGVRAGSALCACLAILVSTLFTAQHFSPSAGLLTGGILATAYIFVMGHNGRTGDPDALYLLFTTSALCAVLWEGKALWRVYTACFLLALAFLTKSFHVGPIFILVFVLAFWKHGMALLRPAVLGRCALLCAGPVLLWAGARFFFDGFTFFKNMLMRDLYLRATTAVEGHGQPASFYPSILLEEFYYPLLFMGIGLLAALCVSRLYARTASQTDMEQPPLNWLLLLKVALCVALPALLFQCSQSKLTWYLYPIWPFIAMLLGTVLAWSLHRLWIVGGNYKYARTGLVVAVALLFCLQQYRIVGHFRWQSTLSDPVWNLLKETAQQTQGNPIYFDGEGDWQQNNVLAAEMTGNFVPREGGRKAWLADPTGTALLLSGQSVLRQNASESSAAPASTTP